MSLVTVITLLILTMLLGMVMNVGRQANARLKLQNAADAATLSGGTVLARGMNSVAFSNHLLCDVFGLTAFLREGRDRHSEVLVPEILDGWRRIAPLFANADFPKFRPLAGAIGPMADAEQKMVTTYSNWAAAWSDLVLPTLEEILAKEMIPNFNQAVIAATPDLAQTAAAELGMRHGAKPPVRNVARETPFAVLWRTDVTEVDFESNQVRRVLPIVDPVNDSEAGQATYFRQAVQQRASWARSYLAAFNNRYLKPFDDSAKMSQFGQLWRGFSSGQLNKLLAEYPTSNLPFQLRTMPGDFSGRQDALYRDYAFVGVAYRQNLIPSLPGLYRDPLASDSQAFAQGALFIPSGRAMRHGDAASLDVQVRDFRLLWDWAPGGHAWNLFCQNWTFKLTPAAGDSIPAILQTLPDTPAAAAAGSLRLPKIGSLDTHDFRRLTTH